VRRFTSCRLPSADLDSSVAHFYADFADSLLNNGAAGSMAPEGRDVGAHLEHLEDIWQRQSVMKTMGLIPDVLTSGEKFDIGPGSQRIYRTLSPKGKLRNNMDNVQ